MSFALPASLQTSSSKPEFVQKKNLEERYGRFRKPQEIPRARHAQHLSDSATRTTLQQSTSAGRQSMPLNAAASPSTVSNRWQLIMMRHAESKESAARDHDREITESGRVAAEQETAVIQVAQQLSQWGWTPDLILCSDSVRTKQTLEAMQSANNSLEAAEVHFRGDLYTIAALDGQTREHLEDIILTETAHSPAHCILCLGHNRGWEEAASSFTEEDVRLQPSTAALLEASGSSWEEAFAANTQPWHLVGILQPQMELLQQQGGSYEVTERLKQIGEGSLGALA